MIRKKNEMQVLRLIVKKAVVNAVTSENIPHTLTETPLLKNMTHPTLNKKQPKLKLKTRFLHNNTHNHSNNPNYNNQHNQ
jgi:hypothetical protein